MASLVEFEDVVLRFGTKTGYGLIAGQRSMKEELDGDIAVEARKRVMLRHRVLNLMTHVDPWKRPDLDHAAVQPMRDSK